MVGIRLNSSNAHNNHAKSAFFQYEEPVSDTCSESPDGSVLTAIKEKCILILHFALEQVVILAGVMGQDGQAAALLAGSRLIGYVAS